MNRGRKLFSGRNLLGALHLGIVASSLLGAMCGCWRWMQTSTANGINSSPGAVTAVALFYVLVLLLIGFLFFVLYRGSRIPQIRILVFAGLFVWGSTAYFFHPVDRVRVRQNVRQEERVRVRAVEAPNRVLSSFFPSRGGYEQITVDDPFHYFGYHLLVISFTCWILFAFLGRGFVSRVSTMVAACLPWLKLDVFWDVSEQGLMLAESIMRETCTHQVLFRLPIALLDDKDKLMQITRRIDAINCQWVLTDFDLTDKNWLVKEMAGVGRRHFFLRDSAHENVTRANRLASTLKKVKKSETDRGKVFYVRIDPSEDQRVFLDWCEKVREKVEPIVIDESEMVADDFAAKYTRLRVAPDSVDGCHVKDDFRVLLIGFGYKGWAVLRNIACNGQLLKRGSTTQTGLGVDIVDHDEDAIAGFLYYHPGLINGTENELHVRFLPAQDALRYEFDAWLTEHLRDYDQVVICLPKDEENIRLAERIKKIKTSLGLKISLVVQILNMDRRDYWTSSDAQCFGALKDLYRWSRIDHAPVDAMAKALHAKWKTKLYAELTEKTKQEQWRGCKFFDRQSSRASARCEENLLRLLGYEVVDEVAKNLEVVSDEEVRREIEDHLDTLARNEHLRWNAFMVLSGVERWDMENPRLEEIDEKERKLNQRKEYGRHAAIVPYDQLPEVDYRLAKSLNEHHGVPTVPALEMKDDAEYLQRKWVHKKGRFEVEMEKCTQAKDREFCSLIVDNVHSAGRQIVRLKGRGQG